MRSFKINYPIEHGIVTDWTDMERLWEYTFESQRIVDPETRNVLLTEAPQNPRKNKEKMMESCSKDLMFRPLMLLYINLIQINLVKKIEFFIIKI